MNNLMRKLAGFEDKKDKNVESLNIKNNQKKNVKSQIFSGVSLFCRFAIWVIVLSLISALIKAMVD